MNEDVCPSRMVDHDTGRILHCGSNHATEDMHFAPGTGWKWSSLGTMPADQPCDHRCARCVERTRDAVLEAAIAWYDTGDNHAQSIHQTHRMVLINAIYEYRAIIKP